MKPDILVYTEEGRFVSEKWLRFAQILDDMQSYLELQWIPPEYRGKEDKPYAIVHSLPGRKPYVVFYAGELDDPVDLLARLWAGDTTKNNPLKVIETREQAERAFELRRNIEELEDAADEVHFWMTNRSPWYGIRKRPDGTKVKLDTQNGREIR